MGIKNIGAVLFRKIRRLPVVVVALSGTITIVLGTYGLVFFNDKSVSFSYSDKTCIKQLTVFPAGYRQSGDDFRVHLSDVIKIGDFPLAALTACFSPASSPEQGISKISISPFGGWVAKKTFAISVPALPILSTAPLTKPIPVTKTLEFPLDVSDAIFSYQLAVDGNSFDCAQESSVITCDVGARDLLQGKEYLFELNRRFNGDTIDKLFAKRAMTLSATTVINTSIKREEEVFSKPRSIELEFDKDINIVSAALRRVEGDKRTEVEASVNKNGKKVTVSIATDLTRSSDYELVVSEVEANDGSSLEESYKLPFKTSGGPKVTRVNTGRTGVPIGALVTVSFDQNISETQDISKVVSLGGGAAIASRGKNEIVIATKGVPKCGDFSIKITNDLQSSYDVTGNSAWEYTGRMICHTIGSIGVSSKGRSINAYYFGQGAQTIVYTGAIHGNEVSTKYLMEQWIRELEANARDIPANRSVIVIPQLNPDGVANGARTNGRNIDLNRNFATTDWQKDITTVNDQSFPGGGGDSPMSEPETRAISSFVQRLRPILVLSYHSIGGVLAANQAGNSSSWAATYSRLSGYRNVTGSGDTFDYAISGTADDWYAQTLGVPSILIELGSHTNSQFDRNKKAMWSMAGV